ncbi:hypothetical protein QIS74_13713 [Colletotrichum tabaci]|uniref:Uncharacterized protein n=1 Tax=Colletotrichum tabaci TaxID=1209068 RepID=A0AAV9STG9_9PEZI
MYDVGSSGTSNEVNYDDVSPPASPTLHLRQFTRHEALFLMHADCKFPADYHCYLSADDRKSYAQSPVDYVTDLAGYNQVIPEEEPKLPAKLLQIRRLDTT